MSKVTPTEAWAALRSLRERRVGPHIAVVEAAIEKWAREANATPPGVPCACGSVLLNPAIADEDASRTALSRAQERLQTAEELRRLAPVVAKEISPGAVRRPAPQREGLFPFLDGPADAMLIEKIDEFDRRRGRTAQTARNELDALVRALEHSDLSLPATRDLEVVLIHWSREVDRSTYPCPYCGRVIGLEDMIVHLGLEELVVHRPECRAHPVLARAASLVREVQCDLGESVGERLLRIVARRGRLQAALVMLSRANETFDANMHWGSECGAYSKPVDEGPWLAAMRRAGEIVEHEASAIEADGLANSLSVDRLRAEAATTDKCLRQLLRACRTYWNGMGDGEGGRSIENRALVSQLEAARDEAKRALSVKWLEALV